jgi:hypothetical protein
MPNERPEEPLPCPKCGTEAARDFITARDADVGLLMFVTHAVLTGDYVVHVAQRALDGAELDGEVTPESLASAAPGRNTLALRQKSQALLEMLLLRSVDNYLKYVVDMVRSVLKKQPNLLRSKQQTLSLEQILNHSSIEELLHFIIESRVNSLSYEGFERMRDWCATRGIPLITEGEADYAKIVEFIATRNLIAHSRCRVDEKYIRTVVSSERSVGGVREISVDDYFECVRVLSRSVAQADAGVAAKFDLDTVTVATEHEPCSHGGQLSPPGDSSRETPG